VVTVFVGIAAALPSIGAGAKAPEKADQQPPVRKFMREKLTDAQNILEGLATEDFDLIIRGGEHLRTMSLATEWNLIPGPEFKAHSEDFRRAAKDVTDKARDENLDGVALAYLQLTMRCIDCHKFVRSTRVAGLQLPSSR